MFRRTFLISAASACAAWPALAAPQRYTLDPKGSAVRFTYRLNGAPLTGTMPIETATIGIDFSDVTRTSAQVTLRPDRAKAGVVFATEAMRSPTVLDTERHPRIAFTSTRTRSTGQGAQVEGRLTIRGTTQPVRLAARFAQAPGARPGDLSRLTILLSGSVSRTAFGAGGYPNLVDDRIDLAIRADLRRQG